MRAAQKFFAAIGNPLDGTGKGVRTKSGNHIFSIGPCFHAKATAHIAHNDADVFFVDADQIRHGVANACWHLAAHANKQSTVFRVGQNATGFNGKSRYALVHDVQMDHVGGFCEGFLVCFCVAIPSFCHPVVWCVCEKRCAGGQCIA